MDMYNRIDRHELPNSVLIRNAVIQYLNNTDGLEQSDITVEHKDKNDETCNEIYNEVYNTLYNIEIMSLKKDIKYLNDKICGLEQNVFYLKDDKLFLQEQLHAQTILAAAKTPLLTRIKMKLLRQNSE